MSSEVVHWLLRTVTYGSVVLIVGFLGVARLCEAFEHVANALGPLGRWLRRKSLERVRAALKVQDDYKSLLRRIDILEKMIGRMEEESRRARKKFEEKIKRLELVEESQAAQQDMTAEYLRVDAQWHIDQGTLAVEEHYQLLPHQSYTKFCLEYREKHGMGYGRRWSDDPKR